MDPITIQVLRNKITSLIDEMHYHFCRSGYTTHSRIARLQLRDPRSRGAG